MSKPKPALKPRTQIQKSLTGIVGLDEITGGGLPKGRPTLVCGSAGCGKTLLAMEFLVRGATQFDEPGVFLAFEETAADLTENVASLGFDLNELIARKKLVLDFIYIERSEIEETGEYDLEGLFIRLGSAIDAVGAKRVVLDTIESLFAGLPNPLVLRAEMRRLFRWLKEKGVTAIITGESGEKTLTRQGMEEYVSDCVIVLDHRVKDQASSRRLRIVKYRGSIHGTNEYPFLIDEDGISVLPVTSLGLQHIASTDRIPTGIARLDAMLGGKGFFRSSSVLVSGTAGTGKSSLAAHFCDAACRRGERALYFAFEESPSQIMRNMCSIGLDLKQWEKKGLLLFQATRPSFAGLEMQLTMMHKAVNRYKPQVVIVDPLNGFIVGDNMAEVKSMLMRMADFLKTNQITSLFTALTSSNSPFGGTNVAISTLIDTWLVLRDIEDGGERNRSLLISKSRGMVHSNQICEYLMTGHGMELCEPYVSAGSVLTGSARLAQEAKKLDAKFLREQKNVRRQLELESKRRALDAQIDAMRAQFEVHEAETMSIIGQHQAQATQSMPNRSKIGMSRQTDTATKGRRSLK